MILSDNAVSRLADTREGDLADVPFAVLLYALARSERSATLTITRKPLVKEITIERGIPVHCRSNLAHETLNRFLQSTGDLDETTANECFSEACARGVRFGDILLGRRLISAEDLRKVLQKNLARKLLDGFSWQQGRYRLSEFPFEVDSTLKVNVPQLILLGVNRFATRQQVDASIKPLVGQVLALDPEPFFDLGEVRLTATQQSTIEALDGHSRRIDELAESTGIGDDNLTRTLYALTLIGVVVPATMPTKTAQATPAIPPIRPATVPSRKPSATLSAEDEERRTALMEMVLNFRRKDAFELLDVDPDGFGRETQDRFLAFSETYAPWTYPDDLKVDAGRVFLAGARAFGELNDPERREALANRRRGRRGRLGSVNTFRIETDLLDPEVQFRKGRALMAEGNYREALEQLAYASDLDPQNGNYRAELAYCRYLYNPQGAGPSAVADLKKALRIDPGNGIVHFYLGEILAEMDLVAEAREAYRRAIKPMAPDRRPIEALKRLPRDA